MELHARPAGTLRLHCPRVAASASDSTALWLAMQQLLPWLAHSEECNIPEPTPVGLRTHLDAKRKPTPRGPLRYFRLVPVSQVHRSSCTSMGICPTL